MTAWFSKQLLRTVKGLVAIWAVTAFFLSLTLAALWFVQLCLWGVLKLMDVVWWIGGLL